MPKNSFKSTNNVNLFIRLDYVDLFYFFACAKCVFNLAIFANSGSTQMQGRYFKISSHI